MIIFGTRQRTVTGGTVQGVPCAHCGNDSYQAYGHQHYAHLYWIPTLPTGRTVGLECTHCKRALTDDELSDELADRVRDEVFASRSRLPMFAGSFVIAALITFGVVSAQQEDEASAAYLAAPEVGDYYVVDYTKVLDEDDVDDDYKYGILHLTEITKGHRRFQISDSAYRLPTAAKRAVREGDTDIDAKQDGIYLGPDEIAEWEAAGAVYSVQRP